MEHPEGPGICVIWFGYLRPEIYLVFEEAFFLQDQVQKCDSATTVALQGEWKVTASL